MSVLGDINNQLWDYIEINLGESGMLAAAKVFSCPDDEDNLPDLDEDELRVVLTQSLFAEWLWFEWHVLGERKPIIQSFAGQAKNLDHDTRRRLNQLLATNYYGFWRVGEVRPGNIELSDLKHGTNYRVREYRLADDTRTGDCLFTRVAQQDDHWEIVSADGIVPINLPNFEDAAEVADELTEPVSIKDSFNYMQLVRELYPESELNKAAQKDIPLSHAREEFDAMLKECDLVAYISRDKVEKLMKDELSATELPKEGLPTATRLLIGLSEGRSEGENIEKVMDASSTLWNALRPKKLKRSKVKPSMEVHKVDLLPWRKPMEEAHLAIRTNDPSLATESWDQVFALMLDNHGTTSSLYRLYANAGVAYLIAGDALLGEYLLDIALELCPDYDFAIDQKERIERGEYQYYTLTKIQKRLTSGELDLPPSSQELRGLSDSTLTKRFASIGLNVTPDNFPKLMKGTTTVDDLIDTNWKITISNHRGDQAHFLSIEANRRWAPEYPWPETLNAIAFDIQQALLPEYTGERRNLKRGRELIKEMHLALKNATDSSVQKWMKDVGDYSEDRQNLVYAGLELLRNRDADHELLDDFYVLAYKRSADPIFLVPRTIERASQGQPIDAAIKAIAKQLPLDNLTLGILADGLPETIRSAKEQAYLLALQAIDARRGKHMRTYLPYDRSSLQDSYGWILDGLCRVYEDTAQKDKLDIYQERYLAVMDDPSLARTSELSQEELKAHQTAVYEKELFPDSPAVKYYKWFKTLDIDLRSGDGSLTKHTLYKLGESGKPGKIGRNDPCPCGKTKPDGTPVKYKKCHGKPSEMTI